MNKKELAGDSRLSFLIKLSWPIFIEYTLQLLIGNIDQIMIAQVSDTGVAAVGNANQVVTVAIMLLGMFAGASLIMITHCQGASDHRKIKDIYTLSICINFLIGLLMSLFFVVFGRPLLGQMQVPGEIMPEASIYLYVAGLFLIPQALFSAFSAFLKANNYTKEAMHVNVTMNVINVIGNFILLYGLGPIPAMGVLGLALSSGFSRLFGAFMLIALFVKRTGYRFPMKRLKQIPKKTLTELLTLSRATIGFSLAYHISQVLVMISVNMFGKAMINTHIFASILSRIPFTMSIAFSIGSQIIMGRLLSSNRIREADIFMKKTLCLSVGANFVFSVLLYFGGEIMIQLFTSDPAVILLTKRVLLLNILYEITRTANVILIRSLQTADDNRFLVTVSFFSSWIIAAGGAYVLGVRLEMAVYGVWFAMTLDEGLRALIFAFRWYRVTIKKFYRKALEKKMIQESAVN